MYNKELEELIDAALEDGVLTEKEKQVLFKKAQSMSIDLDEFEVVLDARLVKVQKAAQEKAASSAPQSNKFGDVKKCPACGAMVQSYQGVCSECGYAFEGIEADVSVKELSNLLMRANGENQMKTIINAFPIPLQKSALIEFITWLRPNSLNTSNPLAEVYQLKYEECIRKIQAVFPNDTDMVRFITDYNDDVKKIKKYKLISSIKKTIKKTVTSITFWAVIMIGIPLLLWILDEIFIIF